jgi:hypothetical protein
MSKGSGFQPFAQPKDFKQTQKCSIDDDLRDYRFLEYTQGFSISMKKVLA